MRIVHVVTHPFLPPEDGGRLKTATIATVLARWGDLHWVSPDDHRRARAAAEPDHGLDLPWGGSGTWHSALHVPHKRRLPRSASGWLRAARAGILLPPGWLPYTPRHGELLAQIARLKPDLVVADETILAPFAAFAPARWRIVSTHNLESDLLARCASLGADPAHQIRSARRMEHYERALFPRMDQVWGVRREDLDVFRSFGVEASRLFLAPNVVQDSCFLEDPGPGRPLRAAFFGSLWYPPNREALAWLLSTWPEVRRRLPGATLAVAGRGAGAELEAWAARTEGVEFLGFVPDLQAFLREAALIVIPLLSGGGTKLKTIEAMASGRPVLATPEATLGLGVEDGVHAVVRGAGAGFVDALAALLGTPQPWADMGVRAREHARSHHSLAALQDALDGALGALVKR